MEKPITAEQITHWFTSGASFASIKLKEEADDRRTPELVPKEHSPSKASAATRKKDVKSEVTGRNAEPGSGPPPAPRPSNKYPTLPITKNRQELVSLIENNSVVVVRGSTGSGKTTLLPQFILDHYSEKNLSCNIVVTQPRKIGAASIARWVAAQRHCTLGSLVGYQVGLEKMATEHTRLIYMTTGVLLQKLVQAKCLTEYSHIFVDEVHERNQEMDFVLLILRKLLRFNSPYVKVILMSATIDCKQFAEYFSTVVKGRTFPAYVFEVEGRTHSIDEFYLDDIQLFPLTADRLNAAEPQISKEIYDVAIGLIQSFDEMEGKESSRVDKGDGLVFSERGSVLVFLPGIREIRVMQEALAKLVHKRLQVFPLHSTVTLEEQNIVFLQPVSGYRKVILSTNIAESSVTVPDVKYVIDFCLTRRMVCDQETSLQFLSLTWASKTNCNQRRGRAGRVSKGYCYRLVTKQFWDVDIPDHMVPDMQLAPLSTIVLKVKLLDIGDPRTVLSTALSPPNITGIVSTVLQLKEMGALSGKSDDSRENLEDGELTFLGRVLAHLPINLHLGKMVVLGYVFGCLDDCLIIAASHSQKSFFAVPSMQHLASYRSKLKFTRGTPSDSLAFVNAFKAWITAKKRGQFRHPKDELDWGKENFIQIKRIREVAELYEDLRTRVAQFNMKVSDDAASPDYSTANRERFILQMVMAGAFYPNYFLLGAIEEDLAVKELSGFNPRRTVMMRNLPPYSFLYYKQLQSLFRPCGQVKKISFDSSRAYVEFYKPSQISSVLPEVTLALFLGQQPSPSSMELSIYPAEHIELHARSRNVTHLKYARINVDLENQSVYPVGVENNDLDPAKLPPKLLFVVNITEVVDVGHFWGFQADEASLRKQRRLTAEINQRSLRAVSVSLYPNLVCLAPFSEDNDPSLYYRAKILHLRSNSVEAFFLDFGNTAVVTCSSLRELPSDLLSEPFQAREFQVIGIRPSAESVVLGNPWSSRACERFIALVKGQELIVSLYSIVQGVMRVELLINLETSDRSLADILIEEGHAVRAEESYGSMQSHEALVSLYKDVEMGTFVANSVSGVWQDRRREDQQLIDGLLAHFSKSNPGCAKTKARLFGPFSPNRINFYSLNHRVHNKAVCLEKNSVNSCAVNENPQWKHDRMMVAGAVNISFSGAKFLLRDTSIMPNIPGLPALLTMLFTPVMELRVNKETTCYTGALCGLGCSSQAQEGILPEHDIELTFDVKFDVEDIIEINALRVAINRLVCEGVGGMCHLGPDKIRSLQEDCQERLIRLFSKSPPRGAVDPVYYPAAHKWNQVDPALKMETVDSESSRTSNVLFQMHPVVLLNSEKASAHDD